MRRLLTLAVVAMLVLSTGPALAATGSLNYDSGEAPNPYYVTNVTIADYQVDWGDDPRYEDDSGNVQDYPAVVNKSEDVADIGTGTVNPFAFLATDINESDFSEFPRKNDETGNNDASALDASEWTTSGASVSDTTTAPGVTALQYSGSATTDSATYANFSVTSDVDKRYVQIAADLSSASGTSTLTLNDSDGDYVEITVFDSSANTASKDVLANSTGEGKLLQVQVGKLTVQGTGDGTMQEIQEISVRNDVTADIALLNVEKLSPYDFGTERLDTDDDDSFETEQVTNATGEIRIHSLETMDAAFDDAEVRDLTIPVNSRASDYDQSIHSIDFESADQYPSYDRVLNATFRMELPEAYDLSYQDTKLRLDQNWPEGRYVVAEYAEGVGDDTEIEDIDENQYSSFSSSLSGEGNDFAIDGTITPGDDNLVHLKLTLTSSEVNAMQASGGGGGLFGGGGGGILGFFMTLPGILVGGVGALVAGRWAGVI